MSRLEELLATLGSVTRDARGLAHELHGRSTQLGRAAGRAAAVTAGSRAPGGRRAAVALESAARAARDAARLLEESAQQGDAFVRRHGAVAPAGSPVAGTGAGAGAGVVGPGVGGGRAPSGRSAGCGLAAWWSRYPGEYVPPSAADWVPVPAALPPHSDPGRFAAWVNDGGDGRPGREVNCVDCARAVELTWRGEPQISAARAAGIRGEAPARVEQWLGAPLHRTDLGAVGRELAARGHGASAVVGVVWTTGGGHAFNAVNYEGQVYFVDAQPAGGAVDLWPPRRSSPGYGYDASDMADVFVCYRP